MDIPGNVESCSGYVRLILDILGIVRSNGLCGYQGGTCLPDGRDGNVTAGQPLVE
jgi:hypothetical protein